MFELRWKEILETFGIVAIIASLIFVGMQIRQDQALARAELGSRTGEIQIEVKEILTRSEFALAWAKMLEQPENLTIAERIQVESFLNLAQETFHRECYLRSLGVFPECEGVIRAHTSLYFGSQYAKNWWKNNPLSGHSEWINDVVANADSYLMQE